MFKFSKLSFEVACLLKANPSSLEFIPSPLSDTIISYDENLDLFIILLRRDADGQRSKKRVMPLKDKNDKIQFVNDVY